MPKLTDVLIRSLKPRAKPYTKSDGNRLVIEVSTAGTKTFRAGYTLDGKDRKISLDDWPGLSLAKAREQAHEVRALAKAGRDPVAERQAKRAAAAANRENTFGAIAREYIEHRRKEKLVARTMTKLTWLLDMAIEDLGPRPIRDITAPEILLTLRRVEDKGLRKTALRLRGTIGQVFRHAVQSGRADVDPTQSLKGAIKPERIEHRAAILDGKKLGGLLRALDGYDGRAETAIAVEVLIRTFTRPGELRNARWRDVDLESGMWTVPAPMTKMKRELLVPLAPQVVSLFERLHDLTGRFELCFPSVRIAARPISENTINASLRRLGYGVDEVTGHGFRSTASSLLNESGQFSADAIERQLGHVPKNAVRGIYNRAEFLQERVAMMNWYSTRLDALKQGGEVVRFRQA